MTTMLTPAQLDAIERRGWPTEREFPLLVAALREAWADAAYVAGAEAIITDLEAQIAEYQRHPETHLPYKDMHAAAVTRAEHREKELDTLRADMAEYRAEIAELGESSKEQCDGHWLMTRKEISESLYDLATNGPSRKTAKGCE